jgi:hypothetical protein
MRQYHEVFHGTTRRQFITATGAFLASSRLPFQGQVAAGVIQI